MRKISEQENPSSTFEYLFNCPGCGSFHGFRTKFWPMPPGLSEEDQKLFAHKWSFNGDFEHPTLTPSLHIKRQVGKDPSGNPIRETVCHSFVENGYIRFLSDCKHHLVNQTVEIPDWD